MEQIGTTHQSVSKELALFADLHKTDNGKLPCDECDYQAGQISDLRKYRLAKHEGLNLFL